MISQSSGVKLPMSLQSGTPVHFFRVFHFVAVAFVRVLNAAAVWVEGCKCALELLPLTVAMDEQEERDKVLWGMDEQEETDRVLWGIYTSTYWLIVPIVSKR